VRCAEGAPDAEWRVRATLPGCCKRLPTFICAHSALRGMGQAAAVVRVGTARSAAFARALQALLWAAGLPTWPQLATSRRPLALL